MKKFLAFLLSATLFCPVFALSACAGGEGDVTLISVTAAEAGVRGDIDYFVVPEPAASAKVGAIEKLVFSGDLQELYGGGNGYPQAVVAAKSELFGSDFIAEFSAALTEGAAWLETASPEIVAEAVKDKLTAGMTPAFNAKNLTGAVIKNCSVNFVKDCKTELNLFMEKLNGVSETSFGNFADGFFNAETSSLRYGGGKIKVYAPDGAPALGLSYLFANPSATSYGGILEYNVVDATTVQTFVSGVNPAADVCVLPVNLAAKLLGSGEKYRLVGTLTHGNLYLLSNGLSRITPRNILELKGKRVGVVNLAQVPGLTFKLILKNNGISYKTA